MKQVASPRSNRAGLDEGAVRDYLRHHPDFFARNQDLLENLNVPHPSGAAVSLVERQIGLLRERNQRLAEQLEGLVGIARENDGLQQRLHQLTLTLIDARSVEDTLAGLDWGLHQLFQTDHVALRILAPARASPVGNLFVSPDSDAGRWCLNLIDRDKPLSGPPEDESARILFGDQASAIASLALIGLRHAGLRGVLAIGSQDRERFRPDMSFVFLSQMGEILAARLAALLNDAA